MIHNIDENYLRESFPNSQNLMRSLQIVFSISWNTMLSKLKIRINSSTKPVTTQTPNLVAAIRTQRIEFMIKKSNKCFISRSEMRGLLMPYLRLSTGILTKARNLPIMQMLFQRMSYLTYRVREKMKLKLQSKMRMTRQTQSLRMNATMTIQIFTSLSKSKKRPKKCAAKKSFNFRNSS